MANGLELKLADFMRLVRAELADARRETERAVEEDKEPIIFLIDEVRVDVEVTVEQSLKGGVETNYLLVKAGVDGTKSKGASQRLSLVLKPIQRTMLGTRRKTQIG